MILWFYEIINLIYYILFIIKYFFPIRQMNYVKSMGFFSPACMFPQSYAKQFTQKIALRNLKKTLWDIKSLYFGLKKLVTRI